MIVTGAGVAFCAGADMKSSSDDLKNAGDTPQGALVASVEGPIARSFAMQEYMAGLFEKIHRLRQPVIAAVNGAAHGGGFALALACDIRIATPAASFGAVFIKRGVSACDMGTSYHLPRLVGASRSAELLLTGRVFDAAEAERIGLVLEVVDEGELVERALAKAREIATNSPLAVWMTKETMWQTVDSPSRFAMPSTSRTGPRSCAPRPATSPRPSPPSARGDTRPGSRCSEAVRTERACSLDVRHEPVRPRASASQGARGPRDAPMLLCWDAGRTSGGGRQEAGHARSSAIGSRSGIAAAQA